MPSTSQIKQYLVLYIVPGISATLATWLVGAHVLDIFHFSNSQVVYGVTQVLVWGITMGVGFLTSHHILKGTYTS
jgi:hypothetical protein